MISSSYNKKWNGFLQINPYEIVLPRISPSLRQYQDFSAPWNYIEKSSNIQEETIAGNVYLFYPYIVESPEIIHSYWGKRTDSWYISIQKCYMVENSKRSGMVGTIMIRRDNLRSKLPLNSIRFSKKLHCIMMRRWTVLSEAQMYHFIYRTTDIADNICFAVVQFFTMLTDYLETSWISKIVYSVTTPT